MPGNVSFDDERQQRQRGAGSRHQDGIEPFFRAAQGEFPAESHAFAGLQMPVVAQEHDAVARGDSENGHKADQRSERQYLPKPFALEELVARVKALGRRGAETKSLTMRVGDLSLNTVTRAVQRGERIIDLAPKEYLLLEFLMRSAGRICDRMAIVEKVWDYDFDPGSNLVDVYIMRLREKIDTDAEPKLLHTVRGVGYVLKSQP